MKKILLPSCFLFVLMASASAQLITNGSFESNPIGTAVGYSTPGGGVDTFTFTDWRFYNVTAGPVAIGGQIISNATAGTNAFRFDVNNTTGEVAYALDRDNNRIAAVFGTTYNFSFDAAWIGGSGTFLGGYIAEHDSLGNFNGSQTALSFTISDTAYHTFGISNYTPLNPTTTHINIGFSLMQGQVGNAAISLDNVQFGVVPEPGTLSLVAASGLAALVWFRRRSKSA